MNTIATPPSNQAPPSDGELRSQPARPEHPGHSSRSRLKFIFSFLAMLAVGLGCVVFVLCRGSIADPDIWWHLNNARYLFTQHHLPNADYLSFTVPGHAWINHEWLSEIPFYLGYQVSGLTGVFVVEFIVIALIFVGVLTLTYREFRNFKSAVLATALSCLLASVSFGPRTILFGYLLMVAMLLVLQRFRQKGSGPLWILPPLFALWINTHGSWSLGLVLFGLIAACGFVSGSWGQVDAAAWTPSQKKALIFTGLASIAALFANPYGYRLVLYPFDLAFRQKLNVAHVAEWVPVNFHDNRGKLVLFLLALLFARAVFQGARWTLTEVALLAFSLYSGLTYIRFLVLVAIVVAPIIAKTLDFMPPYQPEIDKPILNAVLIGLMIFGVIHYWPRNAELTSIVDGQYPSGAVAYMRQNPAPAPLLNFYTWGGYLPWNDPDIKVFIDSRVDIFEYEGVLQDYLDLLDLKHPNVILDKYKIQSVLFPPSEPLAYVLSHDPGWRETYRDNISVLFERVDSNSLHSALAPGSNLPQNSTWTGATAAIRAQSPNVRE
ncbi:MAG TPA: hypothetical protein VFO34_07640 [Candidatus Acidoferrales bacterium]|nr:hypothetical protein [Candidatus Acidoferrales bacterium]